MRLYTTRVNAQGHRVVQRLSATAPRKRIDRSPSDQIIRPSIDLLLKRPQVVGRASIGGFAGTTRFAATPEGLIRSATATEESPGVIQAPSLTPDCPPLVRAPHFVHDCFVEQIDTVLLPEGRRIHLDFEAGRGGYAGELVTSLSKSKSMFQLAPHVVMVDDAELAFSDHAEGTARKAAVECLWDWLVEAQNDLIAGRKSDAVAQFVRWERTALRELAKRHVEEIDLRPPSVNDFPDTADYSDAVDKYYTALDAIEQEIHQHDQGRSGLALRRIFDVLQEIALETFYQSHTDVTGKLFDEFTIIRSPTRVSRGFSRIPLPDQSVRSITWIGPYQHAEDYQQIAQEFGRVLHPEWSVVEVSAVRYPSPQSNLDFPVEAAEYFAETLGGWLTKGGNLLTPLKFSDPRRLIHYRILHNRAKRRFGY